MAGLGMSHAKSPRTTFCGLLSFVEPKHIMTSRVQMPWLNIGMEKDAEY